MNLSAITKLEDQVRRIREEAEAGHFPEAFELRVIARRFEEQAGLIDLEEKAKEREAAE